MNWTMKDTFAIALSIGFCCLCVYPDYKFTPFQQIVLGIGCAVVSDYVTKFIAFFIDE